MIKIAAIKIPSFVCSKLYSYIHCSIARSTPLPTLSNCTSYPWRRLL